MRWAASAATGPAAVFSSSPSSLARSASIFLRSRCSSLRPLTRTVASATLGGWVGHPGLACVLEYRRGLGGVTHTAVKHPVRGEQRPGQEGGRVGGGACGARGPYLHGNRRCGANERLERCVDL